MSSAQMALGPTLECDNMGSARCWPPHPFSSQFLGLSGIGRDLTHCVQTAQLTRANSVCCPSAPWPALRSTSVPTAGETGPQEERSRKQVWS